MASHARSAAVARLSPGGMHGELFAAGSGRSAAVVGLSPGGMHGEMFAAGSGRNALPILYDDDAGFFLHRSFKKAKR